eukprot:scaffold13589_cov21-Tisochrysis_lutea.AAC.2
MSKSEKTESKAAVDLIGAYFGKSGASWIMQVDHPSVRRGEESKWICRVVGRRASRGCIYDHGKRRSGKIGLLLRLVLSLENEEAGR